LSIGRLAGIGITQAAAGGLKSEMQLRPTNEPRELV
jgi:hypothetical protein